VSDRQVDRARRLVPGAVFVRADMTSLELRSGCFDAVVALYSLIHVPLDRQPEVIDKLAAALVDGGLVLATVGWEAWTGVEQDWLGGGTPMWWSQADRATYGRWFEAAGLEVTGVEFVADQSSGHALVWARRRRRPADRLPTR
jgi:hypothetical protein